MTTRNWKHNVYYLIVIIGYFMLYNWMKKVFDPQVMTANFNFITASLVGFIVYVLFGIVLGALRLIQDFKKVGKWKFDFIRFLILGIPSLLFALVTFSMFIPINGTIINEIVYTLWKYPPSLPQVLFRYILSTCFFRSEEVLKSE